MTKLAVGRQRRRRVDGLAVLVQCNQRKQVEALILLLGRKTSQVSGSPNCVGVAAPVLRTAQKLSESFVCVTEYGRTPFLQFDAMLYLRVMYCIFILVSYYLL